MDGALTAFSRLAPRQAKVVELRYFGRLTEEEIVAALDICPRTVRRDWDLAKGLVTAGTATWIHAWWGQFYSLAYVGLARSLSLAGDTAKARKAYDDFFELWKDGDRDIPVLQQARAEYAKLS